MTGPPPSVKPSRSIYARKMHEFDEVSFIDDTAFQNHGRWEDYLKKRIGPGFDGQVIFEVGCFDAAYLCQIAANHPRTGFIGLDWKCKAIYDGAKRITEMGLRNIVLLRGRAQNVRQVFAEKEVDAIWVFHPDPCDRPVELKNRLLAEPFLVDAHSVLRGSASTLTLKTDHAGYYRWVLSLFNLSEPESFGDLAKQSHLIDLGRQWPMPGHSEAILQRFTVHAHSADYWNDIKALAATSDHYFAGQMTLFENRFIRKKLPIHFFQMAKRELNDCARPV